MGGLRQIFDIWDYIVNVEATVFWWLASFQSFVKVSGLHIPVWFDLTFIWHLRLHCQCGGHSQPSFDDLHLSRFSQAFVKVSLKFPTQLSMLMLHLPWVVQYSTALWLVWEVHGHINFGTDALLNSIDDRSMCKQAQRMKVELNLLNAAKFFGGIHISWQSNFRKWMHPSLCNFGG